MTMRSEWMKAVAAGLLVLAVAGCAKELSQPATAPTTDVNPVTGSRGGSGSSH